MALLHRGVEAGAVNPYRRIGWGSESSGTPDRSGEVCKPVAENGGQCPPYAMGYGSWSAGVARHRSLAGQSCLFRSVGRAPPADFCACLPNVREKKPRQAGLFPLRCRLTQAAFLPAS